MKVEWSDRALADIDRFAEFLSQRHPQFSGVIGEELIKGAQLLEQHPWRGRQIGDRPEYRQIVMRVLGAPYIVKYRVDGDRVVVQRVFHGRERRE